MDGLEIFASQTDYQTLKLGTSAIFIDVAEEMLLINFSL